MSELIRRLLRPPLHAVAGACVALLLSVPFLLPVNGLPVPTFYQEWLAIALGCMAFVALVLVTGKAGIELPRIVLLPFGVLVLILIQMAQGKLNYWQQGAIGAMYLLWSIAMIATGHALRQRFGWQGFCALSAWSISIGAMLSALVGVLQLVGSDTAGVVVSMIGPRVHGNLGQTNHFASYLSLGLLATIYLVCTRRLNRFAAGGAVLLLLTLASLSGSRSVWLYLAAAAGLAVWAYRGAKSAQTKALLMWTGTAVATLLLLKLTAAIHHDSATLQQAYAAAGDPAAQAGPSHRLVIWSAALLMIKSAPFAGVGFNGFAWNYFLLAGPLPAGIPEEITDNAHNLVLQFLAEFGLPGGIFLVGAALLWWLAQFRQTASIDRWWTLSVVAIICVHSLLEYPLWYAYFLGPFALFIGAGNNAVWHIGSALRSRIVVAALCIAIVSTLVSFFHDYRRVERLGMDAAAGNPQTDFHNDAIEVSRSTLFAHFIELGLSRTISVDRSEIDAKRELNGRVLRAFPTSDVAYRQSALLALAGDLAAAYRLWDLAVAAYPSRAMAVAESLAKSSATGETGLAPLVEYAASRTKESLCQSGNSSETISGSCWRR